MPVELPVSQAGQVFFQFAMKKGSSCEDFYIVYCREEGAGPCWRPQLETYAVNFHAFCSFPVLFCSLNPTGALANSVFGQGRVIWHR